MREETQLFLAPCANAESKIHFEKAVQKGIDEEMYGNMTEYQLENQTAVWGVSEGNRGSWKQVKEGDIILFYFGDWVYEYSAIVDSKEHNPELAEILWDIDDFHRSWDLLVYLDEVYEVNIDSRELHKFGDYERMFPYRFMRFREKGIRKIIEKFGSVKNYTKY